MSINEESLLAFDQRAPIGPNGPVGFPQHNFRWSAFKPILGAVAAGTIGETTFSDDGTVDEVEVLLFVNGWPGIVTCRQFYTDANGVFANLGAGAPQEIGPQVSFEITNVFMRNDSSLITEEVGVNVGDGGQLYGTTTTNTLRVNGVSCRITPERGTGDANFYEDNATAALGFQVKPRIITTADVMYGRHSYVDATAANRRRMVILDETDFTQAIIDAGYTYTNADGSVDYVVGIYDTLTVA